MNMLNKWYSPEVSCFWTAEDTESEEDEAVPSWQGESNVLPAIGTQLMESQKAQLIELLSDFRAVMSGQCGLTSARQYHIHTRPVRQQPYCITRGYRAAVAIH